MQQLARVAPSEDCRLRPPRSPLIIPSLVASPQGGFFFFGALRRAHKGREGGCRGGLGDPGTRSTPEASSSWSRAKRPEAAAEGVEEGACPLGSDCYPGSRGSSRLESGAEGREGGAECVAGGRVPPEARGGRREARARALASSAPIWAELTSSAFGEGAGAPPPAPWGNGRRAAGAGRPSREGDSRRAGMVEEPAGTRRRAAATRPGAARQGATPRGVRSRRPAAKRRRGP